MGEELCSLELLQCLASFLAAVVRPVVAGFGDDPAAWAAASVLEDEDTKGATTLEMVHSRSAILTAQLRSQSEALWALLARVPMNRAGISAMFLEDCATLADVLPPAPAVCESIINSCFVDEFSINNVGVFAALCALAA